MYLIRSRLKFSLSHIKPCYRLLHLEKTKEFGYYKVGSNKSAFLDSILNFLDKKFNINTRIFRNSLFPNCQKMGENVDESSNFLRKYVPNDAARCIKKLDRSLFTCPAKVLGIKVPNREVSEFRKVFKRCIVACPNLKPVVTLNESDSNYGTHKLILIDSNIYKTSEEFTSKYATELNKMLVDGKSCQFYDITLDYKNWNHNEILKFILPEDSDGVAGFSQVGHIAHLNLKDDLVEYKDVIGEVILDKISSVKTVVNKLHTIDNTFRNFQMEVLAGDENFVTIVKEHGFSFELDFSKIYWNSRLSTEHQRIVGLVSKDDIVFDVFAGVGPFSIPCAKTCSKVYANDLNPHSVHWLSRNLKLNKIQSDKIEVFNMDGRDFIMKVVRPELLRLLISNSNKKDSSSSDQYVHIPMNLPALAVEFLDAFPGLLSESLISEVSSTRCDEKELIEEGSEAESNNSNNNIDAALASEALKGIDISGLSNIYVHCHTFSKEEDPEADVIERAKAVLGLDTLTFHEAGVKRVRNVAPNKEMLCISIRLPWELLLRKRTEKRRRDEGESLESPEQKRMKL